MLDIIYEVNGVVNGIVWGLPIIFLILFTGIFFSFRLGFPQFKHAGFLFWSTVKRPSLRKRKTANSLVKFLPSRPQ